MSHDHMTQWKMVEESRRNDIIQYIIYVLTLRKIYGHLEQAKVIEYGSLGFSI